MPRIVNGSSPSFRSTSSCAEDVLPAVRGANDIFAGEIVARAGLCVLVATGMGWTLAAGMGLTAGAGAGAAYVSGWGCRDTPTTTASTIAAAAALVVPRRRSRCLVPSRKSSTRMSRARMSSLRPQRCCGDVLVVEENLDRPDVVLLGRRRGNARSGSDELTQLVRAADEDEPRQQEVQPRAG